jgi:TolB-like protein/DNA-binding winged helix-turn-helix (wHTH) protein
LATPAKAREIVRFGEYELDCRTVELRRNGSALKLQPQPAKILFILVNRAGEIVSRQELAQLVWGSDTYVDFEHGLNFAIRQIRAMLEDDPEQPRFVETIPKRGYRFIAAVTAPTRPEPSSAEPSDPRKIHRSLLLAVVAVAVIVASVAATYLWRRKESANHKIDSVAVLPLRNLSADPEQEYFSEGMTDQLITDLARVGKLQVISHTSVERYRDGKRSLPEIARELGVDAIVEGSIMRSGNRVRITVQLIDARSDQHVWADSYEGDFRDLLALQDEVSRKIASEIGSSLTPDEKSDATKRTVNPAAYESYLKASSYFDHTTCVSFEQALVYYQDAVAKDPHFAPAQSGLADTYYTLGDFPCRQLAPYQEAEAASLKALALEPGNAEAHAVLAKIAFSRDWNWSKAAQEFSTAVQLDPNDAGIHSDYGIYMVAMGHEEQGLAEERKAQVLDPLSERTNLWNTMSLYMTRHYDEMIDHAQHALTFFPSYGENYWLGEGYEKKGMPDKAIEFYLKAMAGEPDEVPLRRAAYQKNGLPGYWQEEERILRKKYSKFRPVRQAEYYAHRGMKDEAIEQLQLAYKQHASGLELLKAHPVYDGLRDDPRFKELLVRLRLQ